jgi:hypothetical protein
MLPLINHHPHITNNNSTTTTVSTPRKRTSPIFATNSTMITTLPLTISDAQKSWLQTNRKSIAIGLLILLTVTLFIFAFNNNKALVDHNSETEQEESESCGLTPPKGGKLTREDAGRTTWRFMHLITSNLKKESDYDRAVQTVNTVSLLFPCPVCAKDFRIILKKYPWDQTKYKHPKYWVCELHNVVNEKLDKDKFICDDDHLDVEYAMPSCY